ncbi:hypothetical protein T440DRAFT_524813 [Plenodomus tracheiphilus IPT5]|uniref:Uncharacterized protein n=1 Tax=Plenodomus tracheiphilus IPT5 TaxID=1408161 RepID=A0A6A7BNA1_9PLEO|nr:hypothetical protein T440DRAFT_524813 [Plenodomus tracheiphilus IPT5]
MDLRPTPPYSWPSTPTANFSRNAPDTPPNSSPSHQEALKPTDIARPPSANHILFDTDLTPTLINANPALKRLQQDLIILTSLNENETLHWRPSWFEHGPFSETFWTLFNPPNVVTERLPQVHRGRTYYTRRMRRDDDPPPFFIKSWDAWTRYRYMYGIPYTFLCTEHIELLRMGLPRDKMGKLCPPPTHPLYPEPQPQSRGRYILDPATYRTHLPSKFHFINHNPVDNTQDAEIVVVPSNGALSIEPRGPFFMHASQWTHFNGNGGYRLDRQQNFDERALKQQGAGRKWSFLPWTGEQEESCRAQLVVRLKVGGVGRKKENKLLRGLVEKEGRGTR